MPFEVAHTSELQRVLNLPRRDWETKIRENDLYKRMTEYFRMPGGTWELLPLQAALLAEAHDLRGAFGGLNCGDGKTLITYLAPSVIPRIQRPLLIVPGGLVEKTWDDFQELKSQFVCAPAWLTRERFDRHIVGYEKISRNGGDQFLTDGRFDLVMLDEGHMTANPQAACTKKINRFRIAFPETVYIDLSGTPTGRSIMDYWHRMFWALKGPGMPLPRDRNEAESWADVLDEKKTSVIGRKGIGALELLLPEEKRNAQIPRDAPRGRTQQMPEFFFWDQISDVREGYQKRMRETPGVVFSNDDNRPAASLQVRLIDLKPGPRAQAHIDLLREKKLSPLGDVINDPRHRWRWARMLATGFYYVWDPPPPREWLSARGNWNFILSEILSEDGSLHVKYQHLHLDSAMQVALAVAGYGTKVLDLRQTAEAAGLDIDEHVSDAALSEMTDSEGRLLEDSPHAVYVQSHKPPLITDERVVEAYNTWKNIRGTFRIRTKPQWVDDTVVEYCAKWMQEAGSGIIWTEHIAMGERIAERLGIGFCSEGGLDRNKKKIESYRGAPVVASVPGNYKGRNLHDWNKGLVINMPPSGKWAEQLLARMHRRRQKEGRVYWDFLMLCQEQYNGYDQMIADAHYVQQSTKLPQRLLYADRV